jgi:DNA-directed RNA polymerase-5 subunit 1
MPEFVNRPPPIVNEDVGYLIGDNAMDDICLPPELDGTLGVPTFEDSYERQNFSEGRFKENRTAVNASWEQNASA